MMRSQSRTAFETVLGLKLPVPIIDDGVDALGFRNPRRSFRRTRGVWSLNGTWQFAIDEELTWSTPTEVAWSPATIQVPWAPEWPRSGQFKLTTLNRTWTRTAVKLPRVKDGERLVLHLEAVDYTATVYVDGEEVIQHTGGYTPFSVDITEFAGANRVLVVRADDILNDPSTPRGKQDIKPVPSDIYCNSTTGIWRPITLEVVPTVNIAGISWTRITEEAVELEVTVGGLVQPLLVELELGLSVSGHTVDLGARRHALAKDGAPSVTFSVSAPLEDGRSLAWTPGRPAVVEATVRLMDSDNAHVYDEVATHTALLRWSIEQNPHGDQMGRISLHRSPLHMRGVLNQGYDPEGGLTANHEELSRTYRTMRECGVNFARIHQTVPSEEECEIALRSGILIGLEPPATRETSRKAMDRTAECWQQIVETLCGCPGIAVIFVTNETWGVEAKTVPGFSSVQSDEQRRQVLTDEFPEGFAVAVDSQYNTLTATALTCFSDRLVSVSDGWHFRPDQVPLTVLGQHDYQSASVLQERYARGDLIGRLVAGVEPGRRLLPPDFDTTSAPRTAFMLTEMGGRTVTTDEIDSGLMERDPLYLPEDPTAPATWGYSEALSPEEYAAEVRALFAVACSTEVSGGVLTQWRDVVVYWESPEGELHRGGEHNGLANARGVPKVPGLRL